MPTKHIITPTRLLLIYALIGNIVFGTFYIIKSNALNALDARIGNYIAYYENSERRSTYSPNEIITILISASTNTCAITMNLHSTGEIIYQACYSTNRKMLPLMFTRTFFSDIHAAQPLGKLPRQRCVKSVSFGTTTRIRFQAQESPDISCSRDLRGMKLNADVQLIQKILRITALRSPIFSTRSI